MIKKSSILLLFVLLALSLAACAAPSKATSEGDDAAIYASVIQQVYTVDHGFDTAPNWPLVYVVNVTDESLAISDVPETEPQKLSETLQADIVAGLNDLPAEFIWADTSDDVSATGLVDDGDGIIITLGNLHEQDDGSVLVPFWMLCGNVCGIGGTYIVEEVDGVWQVTGTTGPMIMS